MVVTEVRELGEVQDWLFLLDFIVVIIVDLHDTLSDEVHFLHIALVADDGLTRGVKPTEHVDDQLVGEASLALVEEMVERFLELLENSRVLDKLRLHLRGDLLIENELLDNEVEIVHEGLLNILTDVIVQSWLNMEWLVRLFNLLNPHV